MVKNGEQELLIGEYSGSIVSGHRIALPTQLRKKLGKSIIITKGYEGCLLIVPQTAWKKLIEPMESRSFLDRNVRDSLRFLVGSAYNVDLDAQGRIVIPEILREYSSVEFNEKSPKNVSFVGLMNWIEVWETSKWKTKNSALTENADEIAQKLVNLNNSER